ncbi:MAG: glucose-6-phosphate dehydrogenase [Pseudomonadota bacterium]
MTARTIQTAVFDLVVVGATGDLARRKLLPALFQRDRAGQIPEGARILGAARADLDDGAWRAQAAEALQAWAPDAARDPEAAARFLGRLTYRQVDLESGAGWDALAALLRQPGSQARAVYLAVAPHLYADAARQAAEAGVLSPGARLVVEKPFGSDLAGARALNAELLARVEERRLYRIDHYLGKETVQNLMALRFANALFEPVWNARHIDHVQITVAESVGVEGRGGYYDRAGAMRDMVQNHLLQLLCLTAMEPPYRFEADAVRDEKLKVLRALRPADPEADAARGQYAAGPAGPGYLEDAALDASSTATFVALRAHVDNWRWNGTPFYLRTGKRLRGRLSEIVVQFREAPHAIFPAAAGPQRPDALRIRLQPDEGIRLEMTIKDPGPGGMRLAPASLDMTFADRLEAQGLGMPDAYERLMMDVIRGDQTLFMRGDEVEAAWAWVDPILAAWEDMEPPEPYDVGSSGPEGALRLIHADGRRWREIAA